MNKKNSSIYNIKEYNKENEIVPLVNIIKSKNMIPQLISEIKVKSIEVTGYINKGDIITIKLIK